MIEVRELSAAEGQRYLIGLADVLTDCVAGGASVHFLWPFPRDEAERFFASVLAEVELGQRVLLAAFDDGHLVGTVQLVPARPPNQPHRAEIAKLLVSQHARSRGIGRQLMKAVEEVARRLGKSLLVLDTVRGGAAEALYRRLGWTEVGVIPNYALFPDGAFCDTTIFFKKIAPSDEP